MAALALPAGVSRRFGLRNCSEVASGVRGSRGVRREQVAEACSREFGMAIAAFRQAVACCVACDSDPVDDFGDRIVPFSQLAYTICLRHANILLPLWVNTCQQ